MLYAEPALIAQRAAREARTLNEALSILREMPLDDYGLLLLNPAAYGLDALLPSMPPDEVQIRWTGSAGQTLLTQSLTFMRTLESLHARFRERSLAGRTLLDYGCGWGRLLRLALYYSNPENIIGVDAWENSLNHCREQGVPGTLLQIDAAPRTLPPMQEIDLAYAFSIFTHLPEPTMRAALTAIGERMARDGLLVFTFRPIEYWDHHEQFELSTREDLKGAHNADGFAYQPKGDKASLYGDTSMSNAFVTRILYETGWRVLGFDRAIADTFQSIVAAERI
jgi:hypothetical protein